MLPEPPASLQKWQNPLVIQEATHQAETCKKALETWLSTSHLSITRPNATDFQRLGLTQAPCASQRVAPEWHAEAGEQEALAACDDAVPRMLTEPHVFIQLSEQKMSLF